MTLTKNKMIREIGRRTRLRNRDVQLMLESLIQIWIEELVSDGRIEIENFFVLRTKTVQKRSSFGASTAKRYVFLHSSRMLRRLLKTAN